MTTNASAGAKKRIVDMVVRQELPERASKLVVTSQGTRITIDVRPLRDESKEACILERAKKFFNVPGNYNEVRSILQEEPGGISLRILDFFVTSYAKRHGVAYNHKGEIVCVHQHYKAALRAYSKRCLDAFCRRDRILFKLKDDTDPVLTTPAQLNFLIWAVQVGIISYLENHRDAVEADMASTARSRRRRRAPATTVIQS